MSRTEKRAHVRGSIAATAVLLSRDVPVASYVVENLSMEGALLKGAHLGLGASVRLLLQLPVRSPVRLNALVIRYAALGKDLHQIAVAFRDISLEAKKAILFAIQPAILVLDPSPESRRQLEKDLRSLGMRAVPADTPQEALQRLANAADPMDAAIVDARNDELGAREFLSQVALGHPRVRRVLLAKDLKSADQLSETADAVLERPWSRRGLARTLAL